MKLMLHAAALSLLLGGLACHQPDVIVRDASGEQSAVSRFSTFGILLPDPKDIADAGLPPDGLHRLATMSVKELEGRGYKPVPPEQADMFITFGPQVTRVHHAARGYGPVRQREREVRPITTRLRHVDRQLHRRQDQADRLPADRRNAPAPGRAIGREDAVRRHPVVRRPSAPGPTGILGACRRHARRPRRLRLPQPQ